MCSACLWGNLERFVTAQGASIKHGTQILHLLKAVQKPNEAAILHCRTHQTSKIGPKQRNYLADRAAKEAAEKGIHILVPQQEISERDLLS